MKVVKPSIPKGTRDFSPEVLAKRNYRNKQSLIRNSLQELLIKRWQKNASGRLLLRFMQSLMKL
ncbi:MAG: hypothetical protein EBS74_08760 [Flavobacteriia bacterium]|nr:hypothetical protein [Flavobacteriia bacterium]